MEALSLHSFSSSESPIVDLDSDSDRLSSSDDRSNSSVSDDDCGCTSPGPPPSSSSNQTTTYVPILIIGAGPNGLALASRLREDRPAALYTDLEHARLSWLRSERSHGRKNVVKGHWQARKLVRPPPGHVRRTGSGDSEEILVVDSSGAKWLSKWDQYFNALAITNLRSPMFFHPSPSDTDGLLAYVQRSGREAECIEIRGVVGQELSKHAKKKLGAQCKRRQPLINERDRTDFVRPSTTVFRDFISDDIETRHDLTDLIEMGEATSISYDSKRTNTLPRFTVNLRHADGSLRRIESDAVVLASGPPAQLNWPNSFQRTTGKAPRGSLYGDGWCHSAAFAKLEFQFPPPELAMVTEATVCVIGGGLNSAQICDLAIRQGVAKVILICRGNLKVKHFDFDLSWVTKYSNLDKMAFHQEESFAERLRIFKVARNGGSVNPAFRKVLQKHSDNEKLELMTYSEVREARYDNATRMWTLDIEKTFSNGSLPTTTRRCEISYVVVATGTTPAFADIPVLQDLLATYPLETTGGLPHLTDDLQWNSKVPMFVMGAYAALQLGPDAPNLAGTRTGADRVCRRLAELGIPKELSSSAVKQGSTRVAAESRSGGEGNFFEGLGEVRE